MQKLPSEDSFRRQFFLLSQIYARSVEGRLPGRRRVRGEAQLYLLGGGLILRQRRQLVQAEIAGGQRLAVRAKLPAQQLALDEKLDNSVGVARAVMPVPVLRRDDAPLRKVAGVAGEFDKLRKNYQERREWSSLYVQCSDAQAATLLRQLGFNAVHHPVR